MRKEIHIVASVLRESLTFPVYLEGQRESVPYAPTDFSDSLFNKIDCSS